MVEEPDVQEPQVEEPDGAQSLLERAGENERGEVLARLFHRYRERLRAVVDLRLDPRLRRRLDPSDVLQETFVDVRARLGDYLRERPLPFFLWLRRLAIQRVWDLHEHHLRAQRRSLRREVPLAGAEAPDVTSAAMAVQLEAKIKSPSHAAAGRETRRSLEACLDRLAPPDREILTLRFFEGLSNSEAAVTLGLDKGTVRKRYHRALERLADMLREEGFGSGALND